MNSKVSRIKLYTLIFYLLTKLSEIRNVGFSCSEVPNKKFPRVLFPAPYKQMDREDENIEKEGGEKKTNERCRRYVPVFPTKRIAGIVSIILFQI